MPYSQELTSAYQAEGCCRVGFVIEGTFKVWPNDYAEPKGSMEESSFYSVMWTEFLRIK